MTADLRAEGLSFGSALKGVSLTLAPGALIGVVGPNGAGKTTLLRCLVGDIVPESGTILLGEKPLSDWSPAERSHQLAYLPQTTPISFAFTLSEFVGLRAYSLGAVQEALDRMDLTPFTERSLLSLSGGERQRAAIARVLAQRAPLLVLDEPLAHLDPLYQKRLLEALQRHCGQGGGVILALHDLRLAQHWCDELALLEAGGLLAHGAPQHVLTKQRLKSVFGVEPDFIG